jgi:imidazolonepropionase
LSTLSIEGALERLLLPEPGLAYLRHDRAGELRLEPGSLACADGLIVALEDDVAAEVRIDASGCAVVPGFVDAHTHLPFAGWRAEEYEQKLRGVPYEEIARGGGGIASSARAFAEATDEQVLAQARALAAELLRHGTTTFECKSGYALSIEGERRQLGLAAALGREVDQATRVTALVAHAVPPGTTAAAWLDEVEAALPELLAAAPVTALDAFVESVAFSNDDLRRVGGWARAAGVALRAHVEQLATHRSVPVALELGARSVDHLACLHPDDVAPLAASECAAVLLPGAELLGAEQTAPARALADAGAICVLATDLNPGTSPISSLPLIIGLAARRYGWTAKEAFLAVTLNAAWLLDLPDRGALEPGRRADLLLLDGPIAHTPYRLGRNPVEVVVVGGAVRHVRPGSEWRLQGSHA